MQANTLASIFTLLLTSLLMSACSDGNAAENNSVAPRRVLTQVASPIDFQTRVQATGRLSAKEETSLSFKTVGIVRRILVEEGQRVRKGDLLAVLQLDEIEAQVQQARLGEDKAEIDLDNARLALQLAERDLRNVRGLYADSVATLEQLENAEVQFNSAQNQVQAAETGLALSQQNQTIADYNLRYSKIVAPTSGTILLRYADSNELVGPGSPILVLGTEGAFKVIRVAVTDKDVIHLQLGDSATIRFDAYPDQTFRGAVEAIAGQADAYTGTYEVEVQVDAAGLPLRSGFIGSVQIETQQRRSVMAIDAGALVSADRSTGQLFVVEGRQAQAREVKIFRLSGNDLLISQGLEAGEQVVTSGAAYLEDGQAVQVIN
ncbi:MAG TPA: efflux RND transporter periplasmic adaptor subunit [Saprospiraceae bacterium]|nr:efflux RND transporter periplasmic adaptor subunit [Saprospiraceae bacterium]